MSERVEPPAEHRGVRWHWLMSREGNPAIGLWEDEWWWFCGSKLQQSPGLLAQFDWRYLAPCIPPEPPRV